jgi:Uma2 family endonuclease
MAGGTIIRGIILANANGLIGKGIRSSAKTFRAFSKVKVKNYLTDNSYFMPNIVVIEGKPITEKKDILTNPLLVVEVLSDSTEIFSRGEKFQIYKNIPSFKEYLLISQDKRCVEQFYKDDNGQWQFGEVLSNGTLKLKSMDIDLDIDDIYFNVEMPKIVEEME